jgi:hypothetical protein
MLRRLQRSSPNKRAGKMPPPPRVIKFENESYVVLEDHTTRKRSQGAWKRRPSLAITFHQRYWLLETIVLLLSSMALFGWSFVANLATTARTWLLTILGTIILTSSVWCLYVVWRYCHYRKQHFQMFT